MAAAKVTFAHISAHTHLRDMILVAKPTFFRSRNPIRLCPTAKSYILKVVIFIFKMAASLN